jgi:hypothetical protein
MPELITKQFQYDFTEAEAHSLAIELAEGIKSLKVMVADRKKVVKDLTGKEDKVKHTCDDLSIKVSNGFEIRDVSCWVEYNKPSSGQKEVTRIDTGEILTEPMTEEDWTLFSQA